jgi:hypothetical protein
MEDKLHSIPDKGAENSWSLFLLSTAGAIKKRGKKAGLVSF